MLWLPGKRRRLLANSKLLGRWGEKCCLRFLKRKGFTLIARNFACRAGEIDLIVNDNGKAIVFVEVKTRRDENYASAQSAVTPAKRTRMVRAAKSFIKTYKVKEKPMRFDVVAVVLKEQGSPEIRHYENAFRP